jgi:predicted RNA-binding Zn ribbon-like protein
MKPASASSETFAREELAVRFVNTVAWRLRDPPEDRAATPEAVLKWMQDEKLLVRPASARIAARWSKSPLEARDFYNSAVRLREAIYRLFLARVRGSAADTSDVEILNRQLARPLRGIELAASRETLAWTGAEGATTADVLLVLIAWSAAGLLTGPRANRIKQCQDERGCGWIFVDESRAQNRRWCSMGDCGNLAKARRHLQRKTMVAAAASLASHAPKLR